MISTNSRWPLVGCFVSRIAFASGERVVDHPPVRPVAHQVDRVFAAEHRLGQACEGRELVDHLPQPGIAVLLNVPDGGCERRFHLGSGSYRERRGLHVDAADTEDVLDLVDRSIRPHLVRRDAGVVDACTSRAHNSPSARASQRGRALTSRVVYPLNT